MRSLMLMVGRQRNHNANQRRRTGRWPLARLLRAALFGRALSLCPPCRLQEEAETAITVPDLLSTGSVGGQLMAVGGARMMTGKGGGHNCVRRLLLLILLMVFWGLDGLRFLWVFLGMAPGL